MSVSYSSDARSLLTKSVSVGRLSVDSLVQSSLEVQWRVPCDSSPVAENSGCYTRAAFILAPRGCSDAVLVLCADVGRFFTNTKRLASYARAHQRATRRVALNSLAGSQWRFTLAVLR